MSAATWPGDGAVTPAQVLAGLLLAVIVLWLLAPFAGVDPPGGLTASNAPWTDEGFNLANARERVLAGQFATGDVDRSLPNGAYSALAAAMFAVTGPSLAAGRALSMVAVAAAVLLLALGLARWAGRPPCSPPPRLGGANLVLEHGRLALVEATVVALLAGAFVLATWAPGGRRPPPGRGRAAGRGGGVGQGDRAAARDGDAGRGAGRGGRPPGPGGPGHGPGRAGHPGPGRRGLAGRGGPPNWDRFRTALRIWPTVEYLDSPVASPAASAATWPTPTRRSGAACRCCWRPPGAGRAGPALARLPPRPGTPWSWPPVGVGLWLAVAVADYLPGHYGAPNRYVVPALPGLAVLAGFGLADLAALAGRGRARLAGVVGSRWGGRGPARGGAYLDGALDSGRSREQGQRPWPRRCRGRGRVRRLRPDAAVRHPAGHPHPLAERRRQHPRPGRPPRRHPPAGRRPARRPDQPGADPGRPRPARAWPGSAGARASSFLYDLPALPAPASRPWPRRLTTIRWQVRPARRR